MVIYQLHLGRTPLHIAVVHSQRIIIRALIDDFKADSSLMDFSGYFPYMLLEDNLKAEYEPLLTYGRLQRIRTALKVFKSPANNTHDSSSSTSAKDYSSFNKKPIQHLDHSMNDFKQPTVLYRRLENFKRPQPNCFNRTSTLKPIHQNGEHNCLRRASVFENILKSAADAAQNWNHHSSTGKLSTESNEEQIKNNDKVNNTDKPSNSSSSPSSSSSTASSATTSTTATTVTTDPHTRLVQRLDSMISLRRRDQQNTLSNFTNTNHTTTTTATSNDIGSSYDSSTSLDHEDVHGHHYRKVNTLLDHRFGFSLGGNHNSKHLPQSTDPYTLKLLLSLLPPPPPTSSTSSSSSTSCLKRVDSHNDHDDDIKSKKHHTSFSSFHKHLNKKLHRSLSNSSSTATSSLSLSSSSTRTHIKPSSFKYNHSNNTHNNINTINTNGTLHEFHSLPHRIHSSTTNEFDNDHVINHDAYHSPHLKSLSTTALLAETDVRQLFTNKLTTIIKRKSSTISQHSNLS
ncbi:unnamed protein product [Schistosoma turkestanicum]|nr:unnamed protein product [Schistosoma turkestanicum]